MGQDSTGKKIKETREKAGFTQSQLAEAVGTTSQNISQYERGLRKPKYETLLKIANALNSDVRNFYSEDQISGFLIHEALGNVLEESKKEEQELLKDYRNLNPKGKEEAQKRLHELTLIPEYQVEVINKPTDIILNPIGAKNAHASK